MLTFIRKTKNTLLMEGRIVKYMLYGTGEVLLVAIGILLAFSVDNWNENRKDWNEWTEWYENGQKSSERTWDEKEDGLWTYFYENGQKYLEKTYKVGKEISSKCWDKDGNECECGQYWWEGCK